MTVIGKVLVRGAAAAGATGVAIAMALAPQPGFANTLTFDEHSNGTTVRSSVTPSAACTAAKNAFFAAIKADMAEDASERDLAKTGANTNDPTEDQAERANFKALRHTMFTACAPQTPTAAPTPTAQCAAAKSALQAFFTQWRAEEKTEWANHTEGTDADRTQDAANWAQLKTLFQNAASACGFHRR